MNTGLSRLCGALLALSSSLALQAAGPDLVVADFEQETYGSWTATGEAFGPGPARGTLPGQMPVDGFQGARLVNSFYGGDGSTGALTSPEFKIERRYLQFLIGGGKNPGQTCINLLSNGQIVRTASGPNDSSGGSERLDWESWDVGDLAGKNVTLQIVDQAKGGWGHINIDHIIQTDRRLPGWLTNATREIAINQEFLNLPVKNGAPKRIVTLKIGGKVERQFEIELADSAPDWWAFLDLKPFKGKTAVIEVDKLKEDSKGLSAIEQASAIKGGENMYREKHRPQFHLTARRGWNNDPNGLVYHEGEYHMFFQHNPYGWGWGNMHWGHAVSRDLIHWQERNEALYPDPMGTMFSGSAVVDAQNTAGFQKGAEKPLILFYTAAGNTSLASKGQKFTQCLAYSLDRGLTWTKYEGNPILGHIAAENRDPKVIWHEESRKWVMALYLDKNDFVLYGSSDLKKWDKLCDVKVPGDAECPEFFEIALDGGSEKRWIFYGAKGLYLIGKFDGKNFVADSGPHAMNFGNAFYASQMFNNLPDPKRRILVTWGQISTPGMPFNQMLGLPVDLALRSTSEGPRLFINPVKEVETLRHNRSSISRQPLAEGQNPLAQMRVELLDLNLRLAPKNAAEVGLVVRGVKIAWDAKKQELSCLGKTAKLAGEEIQLRVLVDRTSIDVFANDGKVYMPMGSILPVENQSVEIYAKGGEAEILSAEAYQMKSAWK